jgi:hypothetical protein
MQASKYRGYYHDEASSAAGGGGGGGGGDGCRREKQVRKKRLTAQKRKEIKEAFDLFDTDGSGSEFFFFLMPLLLFALIDELKLGNCSLVLACLLCCILVGTIDPKELNVAMRYICFC